MGEKERLKPGKLAPIFLEKLLRKIPIRDERVIVGPKVGEDAAVVNLGKKYLILKTDPITFTSKRIGWYAINVNANDIAAMGGVPRFFLATLLLPEEETTEELVEEIFCDIISSCEKLNITLCGGHTEVTPGLKKPILVGMMVGEAEREELVINDRAEVGDIILLTKGIAIEGTSIIASDFYEELKGKLEEKLIRRAMKLREEPGLSVIKEARIAVKTAHVHAMHDPTEGGLITGIYELAKAADKGTLIYQREIPILPETEAICKIFNINPLGLIASGALLIVASPPEAKKIRKELIKNGILVCKIGEIKEREFGVKMENEKGEVIEILPLPSDELTKLL